MTGRIMILICMFVLVPIGSSAGETEGRSLTVKGTAEIKVIPNEVIISIGVLTTDNDVEMAKRNNDGKAAEIIGVAMERGVLKKDIRTDYVSISPNYKYDENTPILIGYTAQNNMSLRYDDIKNASMLIGAILKAGGNIVSGIDFRHSEIEKYHDQALVEALRSAKEKAQMIAKEAGMVLGKVRKIGEEPLNIYEPRPMLAAASARAPGTGSSIAPGQISVRATVLVVYDME